MIIKTRIKVKLSFARNEKFAFPRRTAEDGRLLSLLDKRNAAVNYSLSR